MSSGGFNDLSQDDANFLQKVIFDVQSFTNVLDTCTEERKVLLFPPVNNFRRFLIHRVVQEVFYEANLSTSSVGKLYARRTLVYHNSTVKKHVTLCNQKISSLGGVSELKSLTMSRVPDIRTKKSRKPDIQIYVPRGRRLLQTALDSSDRQNQSTEEVGTCIENYPVLDLITENWDTKTKDSNFTPCPYDITENWFIYPEDSCLVTSNIDIAENWDVSSSECDLNSSKTKDSDRQISAGSSDALVNSYSDTVDLDSASSNVKLNDQTDVDILLDPSDVRSDMHSCDIQNSQVIDLTSDDNDRVAVKNTSKFSPDMKISGKLNHLNELSKKNQGDTLPSKSIDRNVYEHIDTTPTTSETEQCDSAGSLASSSTKVVSSPSKPNSSKTNNESKKASECDWEELFDDSGDFVDQSLIDELMKTVGKVRIQHATQDYTPFQTTEERTSNGESIIEVHNFPADFKTDDLLSSFAPYRADEGFQIIWVDDTHALAVFSSPMLADEVLNRELPFVKTRPLKNAIPKSRVKARHYVAPPVTRPKTCVSLARRLVSGHLGMKISVTDQQREAEKKLLSDAREKKRQIAKQKKDVWEETSSAGR